MLKSWYVDCWDAISFKAQMYTQCWQEWDIITKSVCYTICSIHTLQILMFSNLYINNCQPDRNPLVLGLYKTIQITFLGKTLIDNNFTDRYSIFVK